MTARRTSRASQDIETTCGIVQRVTGAARHNTAPKEPTRRLEKIMHYFIGAAFGFVAGAFTPSIGRKIKALFVKETNAAKDAAVNEVKKAL